ncbi:aconitate hydratase [Myxococcota bacterium]|nr:aconitate hydratase [Myxococcota bacterium]
MSQKIESQAASVKKLYEKMKSTTEIARRRLGRGLTLSEKILFSHMTDPETQDLTRGKATVLLNPDRVALQDATAQMAILQFMLAGRAQVAAPTTVHCDHLIRARDGVDLDLAEAKDTNKEVYDFLRSTANKYGMGFWKPGAGIIHQVVLENYAFPGGMMIGTDSHTPNAGGLGMIAIGVGGADASEVMSGLAWTVTMPKLIGVRLTGEFNGWASAKDVILKLAGILTVKGGTNHIIEYFGPGTRSISGTGKATITNMGAEVGATTSIFPYDSRSGAYLRNTSRADLADLADQYAELLVADTDVEVSPEKYFDQIIDINLSELEPYVVGPFTPDLARPISQMAADVAKEGYPAELKGALIGSCTNSSYEDISRSAHLAKQAADAGLKVKSFFMITPGSNQIQDTITRDGQLETLTQVGGQVLANACGPCIGQWDRKDVKKGEKNSIITSFNRNFSARNDGNPQTYAFIGSPELVTAMAFAGSISFNPLTDNVPGTDFKFQPPVGQELPAKGFTAKDPGYEAPASDGSKVTVSVSLDSKRLQLLEPFEAWDGKDFNDQVIILKAKGKLTTDHISPAGPWLEFRGHLDKISDNFCLGATNVFSDKTGHGVNVFTGDEATLATIARDYKKRGQGWVMIGDENYGEGSSREHAALSPRFLGITAAIARSFARIAETNLKKQGVLPLTFAKPDDYNKITDVKDRISIHGLDKLAPGALVHATITHPDGSTEKIDLKHSLNEEQIEWFKEGSALNVLRKANAAA